MGTTPNWVQACGEPAPELERLASERVARRIDQGEFSRREIGYVGTLDRRLFSGDVKLSNEAFEKLRTLCRLWDVNIQVTEIRSHRRFIGPFIVAAKRLLLPVLRMLLKDTIRQQRTFNGLVVETIAQIAAEQGNNSQREQ